MFLRNSAHLRTFTRGVEGRIPTRKNSKKKLSRGNEVAENLAEFQELLGFFILSFASTKD